MVGATEPQADAELVLMLSTYLRTLGMRQLTFEINSLGCRTCRPRHRAALDAFFAALPGFDELCDDCKRRAASNPLRVLDCKVPRCRELTANAPVIEEHLCADCAGAYAEVQAHPAAAGVEYVKNPRLVRGLDYYVGLTFESPPRTSAPDRRGRWRATTTARGHSAGPTWPPRVLPSAWSACAAVPPVASPQRLFHRRARPAAPSRPWPWPRSCARPGSSARRLRLGQHEEPHARGGPLRGALVPAAGREGAGRRRRDPARHAQRRAAHPAPGRGRGLLAGAGSRTFFAAARTPGGGTHTRGRIMEETYDVQREHHKYITPWTAGSARTRAAS